MKKQLIAGCVLAGTLVVYLLIQNSHLKHENQILIEESRAEDQDIVVPSFHEEAKTSAQAFIKGFFDYEDQPVKESVESYVTQEVLSQLQFNNHEGIEGNEDLHVSSNVEDLSIYFGQSLDDRQELLVLFTNRISFNDVDSRAQTIMKLNMIQQEENWKVYEFSFTQY
ncbi:hypothetical protein [Alkalicoccobacillus gibsonii]|uniref:hypothetical protein n=1 Tax=Alkalicoccobacillus gibsonii TaxID=79881 RepID=UPI001933DC28|nr:hypothetical protein [Alkalicoccobacillus gibsonii]MBM0066765.1 hypothetical protein [Alkalicoccobacillus gibsonii]